MATLEELEVQVDLNTGDIATLQNDVVELAADIDVNRIGIAGLQVLSDDHETRIDAAEVGLADYVSRLTVVENDLFGTGGYNSALAEINRRIDTNIVGVQGNSQGVFNALDQAVDAYTRAVEAETVSLGHTDTSIQKLRDEFLIRLQNLYISLLKDANAQSLVNDSSVRADWETDWQARYNEMLYESQQSLAFYEEMSDWTDNTFDVLIPDIWEEVDAAKQLAEEARQLAWDRVATGQQDVAEMAGRWRELADSIEGMKNAIIDMDYSNYEAQDSIYRRVAADFDGRFASFDERVTAAASATGAVVDQVAQMQVTVGEQNAAIDEVSRVMIEGNDQLSQQITALSVGAQTQFDTAQIWHFDTSNEGWNGVWVDGWLRVNNSVVSPALNIDANKYRQVKMRLRKVGNPTWVGTMNWLGATPAGPMNLPDPVFESDYAELTANPGWTGTLTSLSLVLSSDYDANNYFILDWITVGRPAPGASTASLQEEKSARIAQDAVTAERVDVLDAQLTTVDGRLNGQVTAIDGLLSRVTTAEGEITAVNESITVLSGSVTDLSTGMTSNSEAIQGLTTENSIRKDEIIATAQSVTDLKAQVDDFEAGAFEELKASVVKNGEDIAIESGKIVALDSKFDDYALGTALADAVSDLNTSISIVDGRVEEIKSQDLVALSASLGTKASSAAVSLLETTVNHSTRGVVATANRVDTLSAALPGKASASAVDQLALTVNDSATGVQATALKLQTLEAELPGDIRATSLAYVKSQVTNGLDGRITANTTSINNQAAQVGRMRANGLFMVTAEATPTGAKSRIGLVAQASAGDTSYKAGLYLMARTDGKSQVQVVADRFSIIDTSGNNAVAPFTITNGTIYLNAPTVIKANDLITDKLAFGAINDIIYAETGTLFDLRGKGWVNLLSVVLNRKGQPTLLTANIGIAGYSTALAKFRIVRGTTSLGEHVSASGSRGTRLGYTFSDLDSNAGTGSTTYTLQAQTFADGDYNATAAIQDVSLIAMHIKR